MVKTEQEFKEKREAVKKGGEARSGKQGEETIQESSVSAEATHARKSFRGGETEWKRKAEGGRTEAKGEGRAARGGERKRTGLLEEVGCRSLRGRGTRQRRMGMVWETV